MGHPPTPRKRTFWWGKGGFPSTGKGPERGRVSFDLRKECVGHEEVDALWV